MEALRKKWNSSRGASILLALLFLLVCMMVGASVLMAAASNAGKIRSNREEHQKYFTLSSALTLLCDEIQEAEYVGQYYYGYVEVMKKVEYTDDNGKTQTKWEPDFNRHYYWQVAGALRKKGTGTNATNPAVDWELKNCLPLYNDLDQIFANYFAVPASEQKSGDRYVYDIWKDILPQSPYTVTVTVPDSAEAFASVTVTAKMNSAGAITLTATLTDDNSYIMEARLTPKEGHPRNVILLSGELSEPNFGKEEGNSMKLERDSNGKPPGAQYETKPLTWELEYIVKKEAPAKEGGTP